MKKTDGGGKRERGESVRACARQRRKVGEDVGRRQLSVRIRSPTCVPRVYARPRDSVFFFHVYANRDRTRVLCFVLSSVCLFVCRTGRHLVPLSLSVSQIAATSRETSEDRSLVTIIAAIRVIPVLWTNNRDRQEGKERERERREETRRNARSSRRVASSSCARKNVCRRD